MLLVEAPFYETSEKVSPSRYSSPAEKSKVYFATKVFAGYIYRPVAIEPSYDFDLAKARTYLSWKFNQRWARNARKQSMMLSIYDQSNWAEYVIMASSKKRWMSVKIKWVIEKIMLSDEQHNTIFFLQILCRVFKMLIASYYWNLTVILICDIIILASI